MWLRAGMLALALIVAMPQLFVAERDLSVQASPSFDNDKKTKREGKNVGNTGDEDHVFEGQVFSVNQAVNPPELSFGNVDGTLIVRVLKTDEIDIQGIRAGDYIRANGWKESEVLFMATELELLKRFNPKSANKSDGDKKKGKKKSSSSSSSSNENESDANESSDNESSDNESSDNESSDNESSDNESNDNDEEANDNDEEDDG
jgi:hypothetical protein